MAKSKGPMTDLAIEWSEDKDELIKRLVAVIARMAAREDDERENGPSAKNAGATMRPSQRKLGRSLKMQS